jgi:hypothetical protein
LSLGLLDVQTLQLQAITGTPWDVPEPKTVIFIAFSIPYSQLVFNNLIKNSNQPIIINKPPIGVNGPNILPSFTPIKFWKTKA